MRLKFQNAAFALSTLCSDKLTIKPINEIDQAGCNPTSRNIFSLQLQAHICPECEQENCFCDEREESEDQSLSDYPALNQLLTEIAPAASFIAEIIAQQASIDENFALYAEQIALYCSRTQALTFLIQMLLNCTLQTHQWHYYPYQ